jgi:hypothetical protein
MGAASLIDNELVARLAAGRSHDEPHDSPQGHGEDGQKKVENVVYRLAVHTSTA